ncbi:hypothetical protein [Nitrospira sp. KM1]|uniref:hypothetical protein n=1 Tax=Nitrospira sp. KM1 TaxID=1936990 RepID=UPI0015648893|nr:hypothetical protein [Nitrospira sp. KM1]
MLLITTTRDLCLWLSLDQRRPISKSAIIPMAANPNTAIEALCPAPEEKMPAPKSETATADMSNTHSMMKTLMSRDIHNLLCYVLSR